MPRTKSSLANPSRRTILENAAKAVSVHTLRKLLNSKGLDRLARSVLREAIAVREHYGCD